MAEQSQEISQQPQQQNPLSRKLKKILNTRLDNDKELVDALKALSSFFGENTLRARRNLRGDVEKRSLEISEQFESQFKEVKTKLDEISTDIMSMNKCCVEMMDRLKNSKESTADLISKTTHLQNERKELELKGTIADAFLERFQLTQNEIKALRASKENVVSEEYFNALARCKQIHQDCRLLLRSKQQTAGLEIMESMALYQETAYEKLYRWAQEECRSMTNDMPDISGALCKSIEALQDRQVLLRYTLDELGAARRTAVVRCFIDALTRGGAGGTPRPIELYSHDPVRYVGDILAWLHQAVAGEKELLQSLLRRTNIKEHKPMILEVLNHIMEGICQPFKVRVEQVITSDPGASILFKLGNLMKFYGETLASLFENETSTIVTCIEEMHHLSQQMFFNNLSFHGSKLAEKMDLPPPDLSPSQVVNETLSLLKEVLSSHDTAVSSVSEQQSAYEKIMNCLLDPLLQCCMVAANRMNSADSATYMINCLHTVETCLGVFEFTDVKLDVLSTQIAIHVETLAKEQAEFILERSTLATLCEATKNPGETIDQQTVKSTMGMFDQFLANPDSLNLPQLELLRATRLRESIRSKGLRSIEETYGELYQSLTTTFNIPTNLITRTPEHIKQLLS